MLRDMEETLLKVGDPIEYGGDRGQIKYIYEHEVVATFWEDKDYHMHKWEQTIPIASAEILVRNTKEQIARVRLQRQEQSQKNAAKNQTTVVFHLPSHYLICSSCEVVLSYSPTFTESAWSGVQIVHCCQCGQAMKVGD